ncbi:LysR family transcriptional regulator [Pleionea sediminis]|uniref:LysR family transcriptional regulator n=1 Tax=Pleionea sediminis TaxID=2569479 RepID=UPI001185F1E6|nr:LysR family transcriptional regulator [Pleionea sediminis]
MSSRLHARIGTFRQLEILLSVYQNESIKQAATELHLTQPTISMQLKKLSDSINMPLYDQVGRKLVFTEAGKSLAQAAQDVLNRMESLEMDLSQLRGLKAGTLRLSVVTTSKYFIPHLLGPFCQRYPDVDIEFNVGNRQQIIERLRQGTDDFFVFSNLPDSVDFEAIDFLENPLVAIAPSDHPLSRRTNIDLKQLEHEPFLMREKGSGTRYAIESYLKSHQAKVTVRMTIESNEAIKHSVMSGLGISILSEHTLAFGESKGLKILDVKQLPIISKWFLIRPRNKYISPIAKTFLNYIETEGRELIREQLKNLH